MDDASIFISYSHDDKELARALYEGLRAREHRVWIDDQELRVGDSLIERIATAIADVDFFLALVSPAAARSRWCQKELALAVSGELSRKGMRVMPLRVDGAAMPAALGDQLYLEVSLDDVDAAVDRLLRDIASYRADTQDAAEQQHVAEQERDRGGAHRPRTAGLAPSRLPVSRYASSGSSNRAWASRSTTARGAAPFTASRSSSRASLRAVGGALQAQLGPPAALHHQAPARHRIGPG